MSRSFHRQAVAWLFLIVVPMATAVAAPVEQARDVPEFRKLRLEGAIDAMVRAGEPQSVVIVTSAEQQPDIVTKVKGDTLVIDMRDRRRYRDPVRAEISVPSLEGLTVDGSSDAVLSGLDVDSFSLDINGSGDVEIAGRCAAAEFEINGSGDIAARNFECEAVDLDISGSGDAEIFASQRVAVDVSGSADIDIWGGGRIESASMSGSGDLATHP